MKWLCYLSCRQPPQDSGGIGYNAASMKPELPRDDEIGLPTLPIPHISAFICRSARSPTCSGRALICTQSYEQVRPLVESEYHRLFFGIITPWQPLKDRQYILFLQLEPRWGSFKGNQLLPAVSPILTDSCKGRSQASLPCN